MKEKNTLLHGWMVKWLREFPSTIQPFNHLAIFLFLAIYPFNHLAILAAEQPNQSALGVSPGILETVIGPGETRTEKIIVFNITDFPLPIKGSVRNFLPKEEIPEEARKIYDASSWIKIEPADFILQPNVQKEVTVTISAPKKAEPGGHYATIYFQPLLPADVLSPQTSYMAARIGVLHFLIVKGDIKEEASVSYFRTKSFRQFGPVDFKLGLENEGNVHLLPAGKVVIWNWRGKKIDRIKLTPSQVLPQTTKGYVFEWPKKYLLGKFFAQAEISYGSAQTRLKSEKTAFWVVPWVPLAVVIPLLTAGGVLLIRLRKRLKLALKVLLGKEKV